MDPFVLPEVWNPQTDPGAAAAAPATRWANPISSSCCFNTPWCERDGLQPPNPSIGGMFLIAHIRQHCLVNTWMMEDTRSKVKRSFWIHFRSSSLWRFLFNEVRQVKNWLLGKNKTTISRHTRNRGYIVVHIHRFWNKNASRLCGAAVTTLEKSLLETQTVVGEQLQTVIQYVDGFRGFFLQKVIPRLRLFCILKGENIKKRGRNPLLCQ